MYIPKVCKEISLIFCTNVAYNSGSYTSYGLVVTLCVWWRSQHQTEAPLHGGAHVDVVS